MKSLEVSAHGNNMCYFKAFWWIPILLTWITSPTSKKAMASFNNSKTQETSIKEANKQNMFYISLASGSEIQEELELMILLFHMTPVEVAL